MLLTSTEQHGAPSLSLIACLSGSLCHCRWYVARAAENHQNLVRMGDGIVPPPGSESAKPYSKFMDIYPITLPMCAPLPDGAAAILCTESGIAWVVAIQLARVGTAEHTRNFRRPKVSGNVKKAMPKDVHPASCLIPTDQ